MGMITEASELKVKLVFADRSGIILGGQISGGPSAGVLINSAFHKPATCLLTLTLFSSYSFD